MMIAFRAKRWSPESLAKRIAQVLYGNDDAWHDESGGNDRWHVGDANDCWLHPEGDDRYRLHYRYGSPERMKALAVILEWRLVRIELLPDDGR